MNQWHIEALGNICEIELGKTPFRGDKSYWDDIKKTNNVWLSIADLANTEDKYISESREYLSENGAKISKVIKKGTLLVSFKLTLGRVAFAGRDLFTNEAIAAITNLNENLIIKEYLYYYFLGFDWDKFSAGDVKVKGKTLNKAKLKEIIIRFPPLAEQERIVAILDQALAAIDTIKANTEKCRNILSELFSVMLDNMFLHPDDNWVTNTLKNITVKIGSGATPLGGKETYLKEGISLIRSLNVHDSGFEKKGLAYINNIQAEKLSNVKVEENDVLLNITGASIARCCLVPNFVLPARVNQHVSIIRVKNETILPELLHLILISKTYKENLLSTGAKKGSTRQALTKAIIEDLLITYPPLFEMQQVLIEKVKANQLLLDRLDSIYRSKLNLLSELRQSILHKAFSGEL